MTMDQHYSTTINELPDDTWNIILTYLDVQNIILSVSVVCKSWYDRCTSNTEELVLQRLLTSNPPIISHKATANGGGISDELLTIVANRFPHLSKLTIDSSFYDEEERPEYIACPSYKHHLFYSPPDHYRVWYGSVPVEKHEYSSKGLVQIAKKLKNLKSFTLRDPIDDTTILKIVQHLNTESLIELALDSYDQRNSEQAFDWTNQQLEQLSGLELEGVLEFPKLQKLRLGPINFPHHAPNLIHLERMGTTSIHTSLSYFPKLEVLKLHGNSVIINEESVLRHLTIRDQQLSDDLLQSIISKCPMLESLQLFSVFSPEQPLQKEETSFVGYHCTTLNHLKISPVNDGPKLLNNISDAFPNLRSLHIGFCSKLTNQDVQQCLQKCPRIIHLELPFCPQISDSLLKTIGQKHNSMQTLSLFGKNISPTGLNHLHTCSSLKCLILKGTDYSIGQSDVLQELRNKGTEVYCASPVRTLPVTRKISCLVCFLSVNANEYDRHLEQHKDLDPYTLNNNITMSIQCPLPTCSWMKIVTNFQEENNERHPRAQLAEHIGSCEHNIFVCVKCSSNVQFSQRQSHHCKLR